MGCHFLLQGIFPTQGSTLCLLLGSRILYQGVTWETHNICICWAVLSRPVMSDSLRPHEQEPARLLCPWDSPGKNAGVAAMPSSRGSSGPVIEPRFPALQVDSVPSEPQGEPRNTGVGSLLLLQGNFLTQESNQGLLHCRQILHQLSYQGSPIYPYMYIYKFLLCRKQLIKSFFWAL